MTKTKEESKEAKGLILKGFRLLDKVIGFFYRKFKVIKKPWFRKFVTGLLVISVFLFGALLGEAEQKINTFRLSIEELEAQVEDLETQLSKEKIKVADLTTKNTQKLNAVQDQYSINYSLITINGEKIR